MMAAQLLRHGVQPTIIDAKPGPDHHVKAMLVYARSLELFRQMGLSDPLLATGQSYYGVQLLGQRGGVGMLDFSKIESENTPFPFIQRVGNDGLERLLLGRLTEKICPVHWETTLESLRQDDNGVRAKLIGNGAHEDWRCRWIVGADGSKSKVRELLNIPLEGDRRTGRFFVADVEVRHADHRKISLFSLPAGPQAIIPLGIPNGYRIVGLLPKKMEQIPDTAIGYADIKPLVEDAFGSEIPEDRCLWISVFDHRGQPAEQIRKQCGFLIGDAAHGVSPIMGQAVNEGLHDAANLAWKLAGVITGRMDVGVLHTYQQERASAVRARDSMLGAWERRLWPRRLKDILWTRWAQRVGDRPQQTAAVFDRLARLDVHYRTSPLAIHHALANGIRAGDRLPSCPVFDEKAKTNTDLHRWCEKPGFVLLVLGTVAHHQLNIISQWMRQKYPREMHLYYLPYSDRNQRVFEAFEVKPAGTKIVLIRPDMYIGYINDMLNVSLIDTYMEEILGWKFFGHLAEKH